MRNDYVVILQSACLETVVRDCLLMAAMRRRSAIANRTVADTVAADWIAKLRTLNEL